MLARLGRLSVHWQRAALIAGCALLFCVWFTSVPLTEIDEVRYCEATREMVTPQSYTMDAAKRAWIAQMSANVAHQCSFLQQQHVEQAFLQSYRYIIPYFNHHTRYQKPILYYWIQSLSVRAFGVNEFAARLPSGVLATVLVLLLFAFLRGWLPRRMPGDDEEAHARARGAAFLGAAAFATMPMIAIWARAATTDITLTFFITCALLALLQADLVGVDAEGNPVVLRTVRRWYCLAGLAIGLAFLTKGPIGLAIPGLTWLVYHGLQRSLWRETRRVPWLKAILLLVVVAAPWYLATYIVDGPGFLKQFFLEENVGRYSSVMEGHGSNNRLQSLMAYAVMLLAAPFPYTSFVLRDLFTPFAGHGLLRGDAVLPRMRRFALSWVGTTIIIFACSKTQLPSYFQSIAGGIAILVAIHLLGRLSVRDASFAATRPIDRWGRGIELLVLLLFGVVFVAGPIYALALGKVAGKFGGVPFPQTPALVVLALVGLVGVVWLAGIIYSTRRGAEASRIGWSVAGWAGVLAVLLLGVAPLAVNSSYLNSVAVGRYVRTLPADETVMTFCKHPPEALVYYAQRKIMLYSLGDRVSCLTEVNALLSRNHQATVIVDDAGLTLLREAGANFTESTRVAQIHVLRFSPMSPVAMPAKARDAE